MSTVRGTDNVTEMWLNDVLDDPQKHAPFYETIRGKSQSEIALLLTKVDRWANRRIASVINGEHLSPLVLIADAASRDPITGLRRYSYRQKLLLSTASEDELRQVPGIGAATAKVIVAARQVNRMPTLEKLTALGIVSEKSAALARPFIEDDNPDALPVTAARPKNFRGWIRLLDALAPGTDINQLAVQEFRTAIESVSRTSSNGNIRRPGDPARLYRSDQAILDMEETTPVSLLTSAGYVRLVLRLVQKAERRAWLQAPSINVMHISSLFPLLSTLVEAHRRAVDVRVMFDGRYFPVEGGSDDIAFLRAHGISCHAYPLKSRLHSRTLLIDDSHVVCGSNSWSATSAFNSEELAIYVRSARIASDLTTRFEHLWNATGANANERLSEQVISDLLASIVVEDDSTNGEDIPWDDVADLIGNNRLPPSAAVSVARSGLSLSALAKFGGSNVEAEFSPNNLPDSEYDLAPLSTLARFINAQSSDAKD
ncbi:MAG: helix-hairpin-helix domain-containing protein [Burkholderiales bacterium]|nr:helix-hairpin-helix domain-containing protein [Burkholderiales bacterium]MDR4515988.1 phospholipase D-like domain-containing protein [Nitrosomonas sp.]